jgi:hypothetical protein
MPNRIETASRFPIYTGNKAEQNAFKRLYNRWSHPDVNEGVRVDGTYRQFRKRILYDTMNGCYRLMIDGMYIGIESDGYTHT